MRKLLLSLVFLALIGGVPLVLAQEPLDVSSEMATDTAQEETTKEEIKSPIPEAIEQAPPEYLYPGILPDHPLYFLKSLLYKVKGFFVFGDAAKANWFLKMADKRAAEAKGLVDKGKEDLAVQAAEKAVDARDKASEYLQVAKAAGKDVEELVGKLEAISVRQQTSLDYVLEKVPESAQPAIEKAKENSQKGHERAIEALRRREEKKEERLEKKTGKDKEEVEEEELD
jgi:hypothetical protein